MWYSVDRIEGAYAVLTPAYFEPPGGDVNVRATRAMREGQIYRWNGRTLTRDKAYERRAAAAARAAMRQLVRQDRGGNIRL